MVLHEIDLEIDRVAVSEVLVLSCLASKTT